MLKHDSGNKSIIINGEPDDNSKSTAIIIYQQASIYKFQNLKWCIDSYKNILNILL